MKSNHRVDYLLFFLLGLISLTWFKGDHFISADTFVWPPDFVDRFKDVLFTWDSSFATGLSTVRAVGLAFPYLLYGALLQKLLHLSSSLFYEKLLFYTCFSFSGVSAYYLLKTLKLDRISSLVGGLFYMFNLFASVVVWYLAIGLFFPFYSFFPLIVALYIQAVRGEISLAKAILLTAILPAVSSFANPVFFIMVVMVIGTYILFALGEKIFAKKMLLRAAGFGGLFLLFNAFWILPLLGDLSHQYAGASNEALGLMDDLATLKLNSTEVGEALRLQGLWSFHGHTLGDFYYPWAGKIQSFFPTLLSYVLTAVMLIGGWAIVKLKRRADLAWLVLAGGFIFLTAGLTTPLAPLLERFYTSVPFFSRAFRGGFTKYGFILALTYAVLLAFGIQSLRLLKKFQTITKAALPIFLVGAVSWLGFPFFTGEVIYKGGYFAKPFLVDFPADYSTFQKWEAEQDFTLGRYLTFPLANTNSFSSNWKTGYQGGDYLRYFSRQSVVATTAYNPLMAELGERVNQGDAVAVDKLSALLNIARPILRQDAGWQVPFVFVNKDRTRLLNFLDNYPVEKDFESLRVYQASKDSFLPRFYVPEYTAFSADGVEVIPRIMSLPSTPIRTAVYFFSEEEALPLSEFGASKARGKLDEWQLEPEPIRVSEMNVNLVSDKDWEEADTTALLEDNEVGIQISPGLVRFFMRPPLTRTALLTRPLLGWENMATYQLSFDFKLEQNMNLYFSIIEQGSHQMRKEGEEWVLDPHLERREVWWTEVEGGLSGGEWETGTIEFESGLDSEVAGVYAGVYYTGMGSAEPWGEVRNVTVKKVLEPEVLLTKKQDRVKLDEELRDSPRKRTIPNIPKITFVRVNPTKYRVKVEGATDPYTLIFNESFHEGWKVYLKKQGSKETKKQDYGNIVASYFNGDIKEGTHRNTFINSSTFETFNLSPLQADHILVNGYANSWYIEPEDVGSLEDYELLVEFEPQKWMYVGLFVSILTLTGCLGYLVWGGLTHGSAPTRSRF